jgi:ubiquitin fusion degradation protein 1
MMQTLLLDTGDILQIKSTDLPSASLVKLQPQDINFLEITDPKAVLEKAFRQFSTVTKGDIFSFKYNDTVYDVAVSRCWKPTYPWTLLHQSATKSLNHHAQAALLPHAQ